MHHAKITTICDVLANSKPVGVANLKPLSFYSTSTIVIILMRYIICLLYTSFDIDILLTTINPKPNDTIKESVTPQNLMKL